MRLEVGLLPDGRKQVAYLWTRQHWLDLFRKMGK
jgi:hypothetical protein